MEAADTMRLLIVDDNPGIHRVIKSVVSDLADEIFDCTEGAKHWRRTSDTSPTSC